MTKSQSLTALPGSVCTPPAECTTHRYFGSFSGLRSASVSIQGKKRDAACFCSRRKCSQKRRCFLPCRGHFDIRQLCVRLDQVCTSECQLLKGHTRRGLLPSWPACVFPGGRPVCLCWKQDEGLGGHWADLGCWGQTNSPEKCVILGGGK